MVKDMAVVENFLEGKLADATSGTPPDNCLTKRFHISKDCKELKDMIKKQIPEDGSPVDSELKEKLYYLNNIMTEWQTLLKEDHLCTPKTLQSAKDLEERVNKIKKDLQDSAKKNIGSVSGVKKTDSEVSEVYRWSCRSAYPARIYGVEDKAKIVERLLFKEGFKAIGFAGMAGVGKTALCQEVFNTQQVKEHFHPRIWVCSSKQPNVTDYRQELVKMMLLCLGFEKNIVDKVGQGGLNRLILALQRQLKRQKYLIVLDGVDKMDKDFYDFCSCLAQDGKKEDRLAYGLPKSHEGAVIVTIRSPIIIKNMVGDKNFISLPLADNESCWKIFKDAVKKDGDEDEDIKKLKDEIVKECAGLPLIAKMLGKIAHSQANVQKMSNQSEATPVRG